MSKEIPGVPESITREAYIKLFEAAGIDPRQTIELNFRADGIHANVFAQDADGKKIIDSANDCWTKHIIYIPVED